MRERQTQRNSILQALQCGEKLTPLTALKRFNCLRLGARIFQLRQEGYKIQSSLTKTKGGKYVSEYQLEGV